MFTVVIMKNHKNYGVQGEIYTFVYSYCYPYPYIRPVYFRLSFGFCLITFTLSKSFEINT